MFVLLLVVNLANLSAWDFDNIQHYDEVNKEVTITNALGLGDDIAKVKLDTPLVYEVPRGYQKIAQFTINNYEDYESVFKSMELYDTKKSMLKIENRVIDYKSLSYEQVEVNDYSYVCEPVEFSKQTKEINKTNETCSYLISGSHYETREKWTDLDTTKILTKGEIVVGLFTEVKKGDSVEWIPTMFGEKIEEWAVWEESLNVKLISYYKLDETSGTNVVDSFGDNDGTNYGTTINQIGKIGKAYTFDKLDNVTLNDVTTGTSFTIGMWVYMQSESLNQEFFFDQPYSSTGGRLSIGYESGDDHYGVYDGSAWKYTSVSSLYDDTWKYWTIVKSGTSLTIYLDNSSVYSGTMENRYLSGVKTLGFFSANQGFTGRIDEVGIWNRTLSSDEVSDLYNSGDGIFMEIFPTVTLNSPEDDATTNNPTITFNCSASDDTNLINVSLLINDTIVLTNSSGTNNTDYIFSYTLTDGAGTYNWTCSGTNNKNQTTTPTVRDLTYSNDLAITLNSPIDNYNTTSTSITFNGTASDDTAILNVSLIIDGVYNETNSSGVNNTDYIFTKTIADGNYNWTYETCDAYACLNASVRDFTIDVTAPNITIISPINGSTYTTNYTNTTNVSIVIQSNTTDDNLDSCWVIYEPFENITTSTNGWIYFADKDTELLNISFNDSSGFNSLKIYRTPYSKTGATDAGAGTLIGLIEIMNSLGFSDLEKDNSWYYFELVLAGSKKINYLETTNSPFNSYKEDDSLNCSGNTTLNPTYGTYDFIFFSNDTFGNVANESVSATWDYSIFENSFTYENPVVEGENNQFSINVTYDDSFILSGNLVYNGTSYAGTNGGSGDTLVLNRNITAPSVTEDTNYTFYWEIGLTNSTGTYNYNSSTDTQLVEEMNMSETGSPHTSPFINFTSYDEQTLAELNATLDLTFTYKVQGGEISNTFSFSDTTENNSQWSFSLNPNDETYILDAVIEVDAINYTHKFYNFEGLVIDNTTTSMDFFLLPDDDSTTFIIKVKDEYYIPYAGVEVYVQRYYPSTDSWDTVEIAETNDDGETTQHFFTEDALYRFKVYNEGTLLHTTEETLIYCAEIPCTVEIIVSGVFESVLEGFENLDDLTTSLTYNEATQDVTYTYTDTSGNFTQGRLYVIKLDFGNSSIETLCNTTSSNPTAVLSCDLTGENNGTYVSSGYITRSEETLAERLTFKKIISIVETVGLDGVLWSIFLLIGIMMLGVYRPSLGIIFGSIGIVLLGFLQIISIPVTATISVIGIAIILLIGVKRQ